MTSISVTFTHKGMRYTGELHKVSGSGGAELWHLLIKGFYQGQLFKTANGWQFATGDGYHAELAEQFGKAVDEIK